MSVLNETVAFATVSLSAAPTACSEQLAHCRISVPAGPYGLQCNDCLENYAFLVYMYYTHPGYWTCIFGKNRVYYIGIFTVCVKSDSVTKNNIFGKYFHRTWTVFT